jgi:hypothetical protein
MQEIFHVVIELYHCQPFHHKYFDWRIQGKYVTRSGFCFFEIGGYRFWGPRGSYCHDGRGRGGKAAEILRLHPSEFPEIGLVTRNDILAVGKDNAFKND